MTASSCDDHVVVAPPTPVSDLGPEVDAASCGDGSIRAPTVVSQMDCDGVSVRAPTMVTHVSANSGSGVGGRRRLRGKQSGRSIGMVSSFGGGRPSDGATVVDLADADLPDVCVCVCADGRAGGFGPADVDMRALWGHAQGPTLRRG